MKGYIIALKIFIIIVVLVVIAGAVFFIFYNNGGQEMSSYCTQEAKLCSDGSYVSRFGPNCEFAACPKEDLIRVEAPQANEIISSPLVVKGEARGVWFFEGSFPVFLVDWDGRIIARGIATAQDEWMTEKFVPFKTEIKFEKPEFIGDFSGRGVLIFQKDNPSDLPEHDDALEIPILFR